MIGHLVIQLIRTYQIVVSPLLPRSCRFQPSCSDYCCQSIRKRGLIKGVWKGVVRVGKCHPLHPGGYDPVE